MKITVESALQVVTFDGIPCRVWEGHSEGGIKLQVLIPRVAAKDGQDLSEFERDLQEHRAPSADFLAFPLRMVS